MGDNIEFVTQIKTEDSDMENEDKIKNHNNQVLTNWHKRCSIAGLLPKEFELIPEKDSNKKEKTLDIETFKSNKEIKTEIKIEEPLNLEPLKDEKEVENKKNIELDESIYDDEIKIEDKKSFMEPEVPQ